MGSLGKISEEELGRLLRGKSLSEQDGLEEVGQFIQKVKATYSTPPEPQVRDSHLSAIMEAVQSATRNGEALIPEARRETSEIGSSRWRRVVLRGAGASLALKIIGGAVALAATTGGLASVNALPDPAQKRVATAIEAVTPFKLPGNEESKSEEANNTLEVEEVPPAQVPAAPNPNAEFGQNVAEDAQDAGVRGPEISQKARHEAEQRREEGRAHRPPDVQPGGPGHVPGPPSGEGPPAGGEAGNGGPQNGLDQAGQTPAGQHIPQSVPAGSPGTPSR